MAQASVDCSIRGTSPLLMHAFPMIPLEAIEKKSPQEQAEAHTYRDPEGRLHVPGVCIQRAIIAGGAYGKVGGKGKMTLSKPIAACVLVNPERVPLPSQTYTIDSRPVVIAATKGRIVRHRARFDEWALDFTIDYDDSLVSEKDLRLAVDSAGSRVGLLDFRPEKKGPFGRFVVNGWK